ncbi:MAG: hypothetical protein H7227_05340 [Actinobacteria bacterium]|nr:hypothetical protein [Actinomycetota bacterium]
MAINIVRSAGDWFRPHRSIPITPWRARHRWDLSVSRVAILGGGLFLFGIGESFLVQSNLGNSPWVVLSQGVSEKTGISLGWATFAVSCAVLLLWLPLSEKPGFGTFMNIIVIAIALQIGVEIIPRQTNFLVGLGFAFCGVALVGVASAIYITCGLGPGPRDGWMTGLHHKTGIRIGRVRLAIESLVLVLGALLGGSVGLGTAIFALFIGQSVAISFGVLSRITRQ